MSRLLNLLVLFLSAAIIGLCPQQSLSLEGPRSDWNNSARAHGPNFLVDPPEKRMTEIEAAIITPYKSAVIGAEVPGIIRAVNFEEGDYVKKNQIVVEISKKRYEAMAARASGRLNAAKRTLKREEKVASVKKTLLAKGAITQQEMMAAQSAVEIARAEVEEAEQALRIAELDVRSCMVRAPFSGYINKRFKHTHEPVGRLEQLFEIVDTTKVYAVANVPEVALDEFKKGTPAQFIPVSGAGRIPGKVHKLGKSIDPSSKTKKVYVLIKNRNDRLEIGMSGILSSKN